MTGLPSPSSAVAAPEARARADGRVPRLPWGVLRPLQHVDAGTCWRSVATEWLAVAAAVALCEIVWHPLLYVAAVVWIGSRQHALFLLAHEGAHSTLHPDRRWNERIAELFCAWPILVPFRSYRRIHLVGAAGAGMSALGKLLHQSGYAVSGSDLRGGSELEGLADLGVEVWHGHQPRRLREVELVVASSAVPADDPSWRRAAGWE